NEEDRICRPSGSHAEATGADDEGKTEQEITVKNRQMKGCAMKEQQSAALRCLLSLKHIVNTPPYADPIQL
ncbi:hypothetical protein, partial [Bacteroides heparinolyticus]|uniref:hypothetical protein n=1 Tax=Prevotella heparinolytica TaxID=28113 RepID=UPI00359F935B